MVKARDATLGEYADHLDSISEHELSAKGAPTAANKLREIAQALRSFPSETLCKPVAWIADNGAGKTLHFSVADGWSIEAVQSLPAQAPQPIEPQHLTLLRKRDEARAQRDYWKATAETIPSAIEQRDFEDERRRNQTLVLALTEIMKGEGPFSRDPLTHATSTIESMKNLATDALYATGNL